MRVTNVKTDAVTRGVLDKDVKHEKDLIEVTFLDNLGTPHTVYAHKSGPFQTPEQVVEAWENGTLHENATDESAGADVQQPGIGAFQ